MCDKTKVQIMLLCGVLVICLVGADVAGAKLGLFVQRLDELFRTKDKKVERM